MKNLGCPPLICRTPQADPFDHRGNTGEAHDPVHGDQTVVFKHNHRLRGHAVGYFKVRADVLVNTSMRVNLEPEEARQPTRSKLKLLFCRTDGADVGQKIEEKRP